MGLIISTSQDYKKERENAQKIQPLLVCTEHQYLLAAIIIAVDTCLPLKGPMVYLLCSWLHHWQSGEGHPTPPQAPPLSSLTTFLETGFKDSPEGFFTSSWGSAMNKFYSLSDQQPFQHLYWASKSNKRHVLKLQCICLLWNDMFLSLASEIGQGWPVLQIGKLRLRCIVWLAQDAATEGTEIQCSLLSACVHGEAVQANSAHPKAPERGGLWGHSPPWERLVATTSRDKKSQIVSWTDSLFSPILSPLCSSTFFICAWQESKNTWAHTLGDFSLARILSPWFQTSKWWRQGLEQKVLWRVGGAGQSPWAGLQSQRAEGRNSHVWDDSPSSLNTSVRSGIRWGSSWG